MIALYPQICPKCKKPLLHTDIVIKHITYCKCGEAIPILSKDDIKEIEHFTKTHIPRCPICKKDYIQTNRYYWQPACQHNRDKRISIG